MANRLQSRSKGYLKNRVYPMVNLNKEIIAYSNNTNRQTLNNKETWTETK